MKKHEFNIFPTNSEDYQRIVENMRENGFDESLPVILYEGKVLDGFHRFKAAKELGIEPIFKNFSGSSQEALMFSIRANLDRRHLSSTQSACAAVDAEPLFNAIAEETEKERREKIAKTLSNTLLNNDRGSSKKLDDPKPEKTTEKVAKIFNTNKTYVSQAKKLKSENPEMFKAAKSGEKTFSEIKKEEKSKKIEEKRAEYEKKINTPEDKKSTDIFNTKQKFRIVYADPPWSYNDKCDGGGVQSGGVEKRHYDTMSIQEICKLPVKSITEKDAVLFMWVTSPLLEDSFKVINSWGFKYKSSFIWDKVSHNMGHYNSVRHEFLLIATKGSCTPDKKQLFDSVQSIEKSKKHSEKPVEFLDIIDTLYNYGQRIELFCRQPKKENWLFWGNEV